MTLEHNKIRGSFFGCPIFADDLFGTISPDYRISFAAITNIEQFRNNRIVVEKGTLPNIYILREGQARIVYFNHINQQNATKIIEQGEIVGLAETIANTCFKIKIKTVTPCLFEIISRKDFLEFLDEDPVICFNLAKILGENLTKSYQNFYSSTF